MKTMKWLVLLAVFTALNLVGKTPTPPPTGELELSTAGKMVPGLAPRTSKLVSSGQFRLTITPVLLPASTKPESRIPAIDNLITNAILGQISTNTLVLNPTNYGWCGYSIGWSNLVFAYSNSMWAGVNDPPVPFVGQHGQVLSFLIDAQTLDGSDTLSLDMENLQVASKDGNVLGSSINFVGLYQTPQAPLFKANGTIITNGPTSQLGNRTLVVVQPPLFNGGDFASGNNQVHTWVDSIGDYEVDVTAKVGNDASTITSVVLNTRSLPVAPKLQFDKNGIVGIGYGQTNRTYAVYGRANADSGTWLLVGNVTGTTNSLQAVPAGQVKNSANRFYKAVVLPGKP